MARVRSNHGFGVTLGQDDSFFLSDDYTGYTDPVPVATTVDTSYQNDLIPVPAAPAPPAIWVNAPAVSAPASYLLPSNMQTVKYADGSTGFFDPADGTYYDSQGNDVTGYVQNYGGAKVTGTASASQIAAAEGLSTPGAAPRVTVPGGVPGAAAGASPSLAQSIMSALTSPGVRSGTPLAYGTPTIAGMSLGSIAVLGLGALLLVSMMGRR